MGRKDDIPAVGNDEFRDEHAPAGIPEFYGEDGTDDSLIANGQHDLVVVNFSTILDKEKKLRAVRVDFAPADGSPGLAADKFFLPSQVDAWKNFATTLGARARGKSGIPTRKEAYVGKKIRGVVGDPDDFVGCSRVKRYVGKVE